MEVCARGRFNRLGPHPDGTKTETECFCCRGYKPKPVMVPVTLRFNRFGEAIFEAVCGCGCKGVFEVYRERKLGYIGNS